MIGTNVNLARKFAEEILEAYQVEKDEHCLYCGELKWEPHTNSCIVPEVVDFLNSLMIDEQWVWAGKDDTDKVQYIGYTRVPKSNVAVQKGATPVVSSNHPLIDQMIQSYKDQGLHGYYCDECQSNMEIEKVLWRLDGNPACPCCANCDDPEVKVHLCKEALGTGEVPEDLKALLGGTK